MPTSLPGSVAPVRHRLSLGGREVSSLEREGSDPPVLLLHGWGSSAAGFTGLLRAARTPRRLVAVDLPGFGDSPLGEEEWSRSAYAELVARLLSLRGWERVSVLGHSYGGGVALHLGVMEPPRLDRLLLCAPSGIRAPSGAGPGLSVRGFRALRRTLEFGLPRAWSTPLVEGLRQRLGSPDYRAAGQLRPILVRAVQEDLSPWAERIRVETLVVWGGRDEELPLESQGRRLLELIPNSELVRFEGSGHFPFVDEPLRFAAVFDAFMDAKL